MNDYAREDAIALQLFVETLRNHPDPVRRRAADTIERLRGEAAKWQTAFEVEKAINEDALAADRAVERALGRSEGSEERDELRHRLRWARGYLRQMGKTDPTYAMAAVIAGITETLADETDESSHYSPQEKP